MKPNDLAFRRHKQYNFVFNFHGFDEDIIYEAIDTLYEAGFRRRRNLCIPSLTKKHFLIAWSDDKGNLWYSSVVQLPPRCRGFITLEQFKEKFMKVGDTVSTPVDVIKTDEDTVSVQTREGIVSHYPKKRVKLVKSNNEIPGWVRWIGRNIVWRGLWPVRFVTSKAWKGFKITSCVAIFAGLCYGGYVGYHELVDFLSQYVSVTFK